MADVKFINVTQELLEQLPITDGQVIALSDANSLMYDTNDTRFSVRAGLQWQPMYGKDRMIIQPDESSSGNMNIVLTGHNISYDSASRTITINSNMFRVQQNTLKFK